MRSWLLCLALAASWTSNGDAQRAIHYDEAKVPAYRLPDPLVLQSGAHVDDAATWRDQRRPELLELFREQMYGRAPADAVEVRFSSPRVDSGALGGRAIRKEVSITLARGEAEHSIELLLYLPKNLRAPVPVFLGLNFFGNHSIHADPGITLSTRWMRANKDKGIENNRATERSRGASASRWPVERILARGYGLATVYCGDIDPDFHDEFENGVHALFDTPRGATRPADAWGTIGAWAWGLSHALDYLETDPQVDGERVAVFGHSRLGKTALWAGARDERFALVISNDSGCGGAALSRREFGETVARITTSFPHWFCANFSRYADDEQSLPIDQHQLIALCAPRPVLISSASQDRWADPRGEFLAARGAHEVFSLLGTEGLELAEFPDADQPTLSRIGYHLRTGKHDVTDADWAVYLDFADRHMGNPLPRQPNIVVVFVDDMGWADLSCFGNEDAETPHIDRLAREGIAFEQFYVNSPICSPSRVAISTGTYPQRWKITSYLAARSQNEEREMAQWLDPAAPMLARSLQQAGYATGHFGKWHMGGQRDVTDAPPISAYGFDASLTNFEGLGPKLLPLTKKPDGEVGRIWGKAEILGGPVTWMQRSQITAGFVDAAIEFAEHAREQGRPFYLNLWPDDVHSPFWPPVEKWGNGSKRERYLGVLEAMDTQLGRFFDYVRNDEELGNQTLLLLCSDNGCEKGAGRAGSLKGYKTHLYEGGIRSPLIVWGPGLVSDGVRGSRNRDSVFSAIDLAPSLLRLGGAEAPSGSKLDGEDLLTTLLGQAEASRQAPLFFSRPPDRKSFYGFENLPDLAVRQGKWKLLCDEDGTRLQLYDLLADPSESRNLVSEKPALARDLSELVRAHFNKTR